MRVFAVLLLALVSASLQGCFPVVAAGAGAGVMLAQDRRAKDVYLEDQKIEVDGADLIYGQLKMQMHVNLTSFNHILLASGEVPDEATREAVGKLLGGIDKVRKVYNELAVARSSTLAGRSNDSLITSNIKLRFVNDKHFSADHVKVVTERNTVYLMGIVKRAEGDEAADIASTAQGVSSVVKMFEYLD